MNTVFCNNNHCGKEYNVKFDNCPFCGAPNPMDESERKNMAANDNENVTENGVENKQFNGIVIGLIWISIFFFGIRGIMSSFANMIFSPGIGCLTLALSIIGIVSLCFILRAKKWALFMWIAYRLAAGIVNGFISSKFDFATNIIIAIANIVLMVLILQIKKNGVSAWSIIFKKHESHAIKESINPTLEESIIGENTFLTNLVNNQKNETQNDSAVCDFIQNNDGTIDLEESHAIKNTDGNQEGVIPATETEFHSKKFDKQDEKTIIQDHNEEEYRQEQKSKGNQKKWTWCIIGLIIAELVAGIWVIAKSNIDKSTTEQIDSLSTEVFDCGLFSFEYPRTFKTTPIQNAPHMVLKLESEDYYISASYWDYGISDDVSIWDDEIFEHYKQLPLDGGELVDISKESIKTKNGIKQCLRIRTNIHKPNNGSVVHLRMLSYLMIQNGYLFNFTFESEGVYSKTSPTLYPDNIMSGLCLKSNEENLYAESFKNVKSDNKGTVSKNNVDQNVYDEIVNIVRSNNEDLPEYLGFGMTMMRCILEKRSIVYVIQWKGMNPSDFSGEDIAELKDALVEGLMEEEQESAVSKAMLNTMKKYGYNFVYRYINECGQRLCSITASPS